MAKKKYSKKAGFTRVSPVKFIFLWKSQSIKRECVATDGKQSVSKD